MALKCNQKRMAAGAGAAGLLLSGAVLAILFLWMPGLVMRALNPVRQPGPHSVSPGAESLHKTLYVADLHCGALMWPRDLTQRGSEGHADLPRLTEGHVALQCFFGVGRAPQTLQSDYNQPGADVLGVYHFFQGWPTGTWYSPKARALHMASRLDKAAQESNGALRLIRTRDDLQRQIARRGTGQPEIAAVLGLEGLEALEGDLENVRVLKNAGYRILGFTTRMDNVLAGAAQGMEKGGDANSEHPESMSLSRIDDRKGDEVSGNAGPYGMDERQ